MDEAEARQLFQEGVDLFDQGDPGGAITPWNRVFEEWPGEVQKAKCAMNIGLCWEKQGNNEGAMEWLGTYLGLPGGKPERRTEVLEAFWRAWAGHQAELNDFYDAEY